MGRDGSSASGIFAATTRNECGNIDRKLTMISEWRFRFGLTCYISTIIPVRQSSSCVKYFQGFSATIFTVIRVYSALAFGPSHLPPPISATSRSLPSLLLQTSPFVSNNLNPFSQNNYRASPSFFFFCHYPHLVSSSSHLCNQIITLPSALESHIAHRPRIHCRIRLTLSQFSFFFCLCASVVLFTSSIRIS